MSNSPLSKLVTSETGHAHVTAPHGGLLLSSSSLTNLQSHSTSTSAIPRAISTPHMPFSSSSRTEESCPSHVTEISGNQACPAAGTITQKLTRRQLRKLEKCWTLSEVRKHARKDDAWIAVDGRVYDITEHLLYHPGWNDTAAISTALSVLAHSGTDCSKEFRDIHRHYPVAWRQLAAYYIGDLAPNEPQTQD